MPSIEHILADHSGRGYVVAPAGFGKTHLIAQAVGLCARRQLVLTHTYAGVGAITNRLRRLGVPRDLYQVDTIASWSLRLCLAYRVTSGWDCDRPDTDQWSDLYRTTAELLELGFIKRILQASYAGVFVDEYQDCSIAQHAVVMKISEALPCRVLGDHMQAIFEFNEPSVSWIADVVGKFDKLGELNIPQRWVLAGRPELGSWLRSVRECLESGTPIDCSQRVAGLRFVSVRETSELIRVQLKECKYFTCKGGETVVGIHKGEQAFKAKCHSLARQLGGAYTSIEEVEGRALRSALKQAGRAKTATSALKHLVEFAELCMTGVKVKLPASVVRGEYTNIRATTRNPQAAQAANFFLESPDPRTMLQFLTATKDTPGITLFRADLFYRMCGVLRKNVMRPELTLQEAADEYQSEFRHRGRPIARRRLLGTTLLLKGLEFDHAIVLDASSLRRKELYVAMTRGAKSVTLIGPTPELCPSL